MNLSGDIIITRNTDEVGNDTPGYWNHAAISAGGYIIEAQASENMVIAVNIDTFKLRYPEYMVIRYFASDVAFKAAMEAYTLIGKSYRKLASVFMRWRKQTLGENCVSVVRKAWQKALRRNLRWRKPDHIYETIEHQQPQGFKIVEHHKDYENWSPQHDLGRII